MICVGGLLWLSLTPSPPRAPSALLSWDKLHHAGAYALLTLLAGICIAQWRPQWSHPWLVAWIATAAFGGVVEILQETLTEVRRAEWGDMLANTVGGFLVFLAATVRNRRLRQSTTPQ
jgi:VanZ family protein